MKMDSPLTKSSPEDHEVRLIAQYLAQIDAGDQITPEEFIARNPAYEDALRRYFENVAFFDRQLNEQVSVGPAAADATAAHDASIRQSEIAGAPSWDSRSHFFVAAAEAMRGILVREAQRLGEGACVDRPGLQDAVNAHAVAPATAAEVLAVHQELDRLDLENKAASQLVKLRYFAGMTTSEAAASLGLSTEKTNQLWAYAKAWLLARIHSRSNCPDES